MTLPEAHRFPCSNCGANLVYDAASRAMICPYCRSQHEVGAAPAGDSIREIPIEEGYRLALRGLGAPLLAITCTECGATVNVSEGERTAECAFCASHKVLPRSADPNLIRPESLVPFQVDKEAAKKRFASWIRKLWFRPSDLRKLARVEAMGGVYIPFWTFDAQVHSSWSADAGYYYYVSESYTITVNGRSERRSRRVRKTRWSPASGRRFDAYDDELVCGSRGLPEDLVRRVSSFDTQRLIPYSPQFLAGWRAESYAIDLLDAWELGKASIERQQERRCAGDIPGDTYRFLRVNNELSHITFKHVLLPIWIATFRYRGKPYRFLVNGQTGEIAGKAPWSVPKILLLVVIVLITILFIALAFAFADEGPQDMTRPSHGYSEGYDLAPQPTHTPPPAPVVPSEPMQLNPQ